MVAKGKDASDLFPAVVKNVVSKNLEVRTFGHFNHWFSLQCKQTLSKADKIRFFLIWTTWKA